MRKHLLLALLIVVCGSPNAAVIGWVSAHQDYVRLKFNNPNDLEGWFTGIEAGCEYTWRRWFTAVEFEGYWNVVDLVGAPLQQSRLTEYMVNWRVGGAWRWCNFCIRPVIGFGYDYFRNEQDPEARGLTFQYDKLFIPVGMLISWCPCYRVSVGLMGEWRPDVYSRLNLIGHQFKLSYENGFRIALPVSFCFNWRWYGCPLIGVTPFYDWNRFGRIPEENSLGVLFPIPELTRWELGIRISLAVCF